MDWKLVVASCAFAVTLGMAVYNLSKDYRAKRAQKEAERQRKAAEDKAAAIAAQQPEWAIHVALRPTDERTTFFSTFGDGSRVWTVDFFCTNIGTAPSSTFQVDISFPDALKVNMVIDEHGGQWPWRLLTSHLRTATENWWKIPYKWYHDIAVGQTVRLGGAIFAKRYPNDPTEEFTLHWMLTSHNNNYYAEGQKPILLRLVER